MSSPDWVEHSLWWHVYPLGFLGADPSGADRSPGRTLAGLVPWLDYVIELGASGLVLGPIFASSTHGYDTIDHHRIDERLGSDADFDTLVDACHQRGLKLMLDGVFNHVGDQHPMFQRAVGGDAAAAEWFVPEGQGYRTFEGHGGLITLNHDSDAVSSLVSDVLRTWSQRGADAWRLDAAYAVPTRFWSRVLPELRAEFPQTYVVGEVIRGEYVDIVAESGIDSVTQYELWKAIWSSLNDRNLHELAWSLQRHAELIPAFAPWTFIGNHDVTRIASKLESPQHLAHAVVVLMTVPGTPAVYAGDEQGYHGFKTERFGGDDEVRPPFPDAPQELSLLGEPTYRMHQELIGLRRRHPWLHQARLIPIHVTNGQLVYRCDAEDHALLVALNVADEPTGVPAPGAAEVLAGDAAIDSDECILPAYGWAVLSVKP